MKPRADRGGVSRPSSRAWTRTLATARSRAIATSATRCRSLAWTPPGPTRLMMCSSRPGSADAKDEWSRVTGFQRVRSTIRIFAATVYALQQRGKAGEWAPALIGPGDLPLSDSTVREALLGSGLVEDDRTIANYRSLAEIEIVNHDGSTGTARRQDLERSEAPWIEANPHAAERAATFIFLASIVGTLRPGRGRGASAPEVKAVTSVPDMRYTITDADSVVDELVDQGRGIRRRFSW